MRRNKWQALTITRLTQSLYTTQDRSAGTSEKHPITPWWWTHPSPYQTHLLSNSHKWSLVHNHNRSHSMLRRPKLRSVFQLIACGGTRHSPVRYCHRRLAGPSAKTCSRGSTAKQVFLWVPTLYILSSRHTINTEEIPSYHPVSTSNQIWQCYLTWSHKSDKCGPINSDRLCVRFTAPLWRKQSWAARQSSRSTGRSTFLSSPMVRRDGWWLKGRDRGYKRPRWVFSEGWLASIG